MKYDDQLGVFAEELDKLIDRFMVELDLPNSSICGVLMFKMYELAKDAYDSAEKDEEEDEDDEDGDEWKKVDA